MCTRLHARLCVHVWQREGGVGVMMMMMFQQEIKWGWTASVSLSLLQYQLQQPNHDVIMSPNRERHFSSALWLIAQDNYPNQTPITKSKHWNWVKQSVFFFFFYFLACMTLDWDSSLRVYTLCVHVCYVSVFISKRWSRGSISHTWRKWGNLGPGVKEVMDFNAAIVVNGSLN